MTMRPPAPPLFEPPPAEETTQPGTPTAKAMDDALGRFARDVLPRILLDVEVRISRSTAAAAAAAVINAIGERLYSLESDVRRLNEGERTSGEWRAAVQRDIDELKAWRRDTERCGPPSEGGNVQ